MNSGYMMTKKEAVKLLNEFEHYLTNGNPIWNTEDVAQAFDIALTALEKEDNTMKHYRYIRSLNETDNTPHAVSEVICVKCGHRWVSVRPEITLLKQLECPNCGKGFVVETGQPLDAFEQEDA